MAEKWAKLAAFRALLLDGEALVELGGRQVPVLLLLFTWTSALHLRGLLSAHNRTWQPKRISLLVINVTPAGCTAYLTIPPRCPVQNAPVAFI